MTNALESLLTWRTLLGAVLAYSVAPYALLWVVVRCWPRDHPRRAEYLAEYDVVPTFARPFWVADAATRSVLDGLAERWRVRRLKPLTQPSLKRTSFPGMSSIVLFPLGFPQFAVLMLIAGDGAAEFWPLCGIFGVVNLAAYRHARYRVQLRRWSRSQVVQAG